MWWRARAEEAAARRAEIEERVAALDREERRQERELFRASIESMTAMCRAAFAAQEAQQAAFAKFLASFDIGAAPQVRVWDEDEDAVRYADRLGKALPAELAGLDRVEQFKMLVDKMDQFGRD